MLATPLHAGVHTIFTRGILSRHMDTGQFYTAHRRFLGQPTLLWVFYRGRQYNVSETPFQSEH